MGYRGYGGYGGYKAMNDLYIRYIENKIIRMIHLETLVWIYLCSNHINLFAFQRMFSKRIRFRHPSQQAVKLLVAKNISRQKKQYPTRQPIGSTYSDTMSPSRTLWIRARRTAKRRRHNGHLGRLYESYEQIIRICYICYNIVMAERINYISNSCTMQLLWNRWPHGSLTTAPPTELNLKFSKHIEQIEHGISNVNFFFLMKCPTKKQKKNYVKTKISVGTNEIILFGRFF